MRMLASCSSSTRESIVRAVGARLSAPDPAYMHKWIIHEWRVTTETRREPRAMADGSPTAAPARQPPALSATQSSSRRLSNLIAAPLPTPAEAPRTSHTKNASNAVAATRQLSQALRQVAHKA